VGLVSPRRGGLRDLQADFFVLRTPLLALPYVLGWTEETRALAACGDDDTQLEAALADDRARLRDRLAELVADDQIVDGLELASPDLADAVFRRRVDPGTKRGRSAEQSLVRYVTRLASRPDLFGLAGGYLVGRFTDHALLALGPRSELEVRVGLDSGLLQDVLRQAAQRAADSQTLAVRRNPDLYRIGGRFRVATRKLGTPHHRLVEIRPTSAIEQALDAAGECASVRSLVASLQASGRSPDDAEQLVKRLISNGLLVPVARISVTGRDPTIQAIEALESLPEGTSGAEAIRRASAAVSAAPRIGGELIATVSGIIASTGVEVNRRRCLQVNARRTGNVQLPRRVLHEMGRCIDLLVGMTPAGQDELAPFRDAFERRFGTRRIPLLEALDPDYGVRLEPAPGVHTGSDADRIRRQRVLLELIERGRSAPGAVVELGDSDLARLSAQRPAELPRSFAMVASLIGADAAAVARGDFQLVEPGIMGSSGVRLLGRLCRGDPELEANVREHLRREAALESNAILAEVSVAPETDAGLNVTQRPVLRDWEIEYGGASGAPPARRLEPSDLLVSVENGEVVLHSARLERRVIPSCSTAMNPLWVSLPAARLLLSIAYQRVTGFLGWGWGELGDAPALPRVIHGRTIFCLRRWNVSAGEFANVAGGTDAPGFRRLQEWRIGRGLPRTVAFDHPKSRLLVDFGNVLSVDAFLAAVQSLDMLRFVEVAAAEQSPVQGPDGHYAHELIVPFTLGRPTARPEQRTRRPSRHVSASQRRFEPGTDWLYANLYGSISAADRVLVDYLAPLVAALRESDLIDRWFFVRYADPAAHLRVRFHGRPGDLLGDVLPALSDATAPALAKGLLYRISLDTYEREVERYGGSQGVELMEQAAEADSEAVIELLGHPVSAVQRRHLTVASLAALYADAALPIDMRHQCCVRLRASWAPGSDESLGALLGAGERSERADVARTVAGLQHADAEPTVVALRNRSRDLRPILGRLRALDGQGVLERPFDDVMCSLAHMGVNRLLRRGGNHDELRVHDALARLYEARIARDGLRQKSLAAKTDRDLFGERPKAEVR
jgi:thiopeptide-type bacteriocin biosynthesis protein